MRIVIFSIFVILCFLHVANANAQDRLQEIQTTGNEINWSQFPDFKLPFIVVYDGPVPPGGEVLPLKKGFSHIAGDTRGYSSTISKKSRVYLWTGVSEADGWAKKTRQPWELAKIPWGNDIGGYRKAWWNRLVHVSKTWRKGNEPITSFGIVIADVENALQTNSNILSLKNHQLVPKNFQSLSDHQFLEEYYSAMASLYNEPLRLLRDSLGSNVLISSYGDTPILRSWWEIDEHSWESWQNDSQRVNYLVKDSNGLVNSPFYENLDFISPTSYYFYNPIRNEIGKKYLAYLLFQIDANRAWTTKRQLIFVWLNFHDSVSKMEPISAVMAEASAIFPLMSGVGVYNWRMKGNEKGNFEYFIRGLYRVSKFSDMFDGTEIYLQSGNPRDEFINRKPIWRAVLNNSRLLVAASNPFGERDQKEVIEIEYLDCKFLIELRGDEIELVEFSIN